VRITKDLLGGLLFTSIGALALGMCWHYEMGTALRMGPGYFPRIVSGLTLVLGVMHVIRALRDPSGERCTGFAWRPLCVITMSIAGFALLIQPFGVVPAVAFLVLGSWFAHPARRLRSLPLLLAVGMTLPILIFNIGLKMPLTILGF